MRRVEQYLMGSAEEDDNFRSFLREEKLDNYMDDVVQNTKGWLGELLKNLGDNLELMRAVKNRCLSVDVIANQARMSFDLIRANCLQDVPSLITLTKSREALEETIVATVQQRNDVLPAIVLGNAPQKGAHCCRLWICDNEGKSVMQTKQQLLSLLNDANTGAGWSATQPVESLVKHLDGGVVDPPLRVFDLKAESQPDHMHVSSMVIHSLLNEVSVVAVFVGDFDPKKSQIRQPDFDRVYYAPGQERPIDIPQGFKATTWEGDLGRGYPVPAGWTRVSLGVAKSAEEFDKKWGSWKNAYHGTASASVMSILSTGLRSATGVFSWDSPVVYVSASILYASHPRYAKTWRSNGREYQIVLQVRVDPRRIQNTGGVTIGNKARFNDPNMPTSYSEVEWLVRPGSSQIRLDAQEPFRRGVANVCKEDGIVVYGILMRSWPVDEQPPDAYWWE